MAGKHSPEDTINAIISVLSDNSTGLPDMFDTIDGEWSDNIELEDIANWHRAALQVYPKTPCQIVVSSESEIPDRFRKSNQFIHRISIGTIVRSQKSVSYQSVTLEPAEDAAIRLERTLEGTKRVLEANDTLTVSSVCRIDQLLVTGIEYSETFTVPGQQEMFEKRGVLYVDCWVSP